MSAKSRFVAEFAVIFSLQVQAETLYVDLNCANPTPPYSTWATAATNIQEAVNVSTNSDVIAVTNGHYLLSSEIVVSKGIQIGSVNGPESTVIDGQGLVRCFKLDAVDCVVSGFTITNGNPTNNAAGGGIYCEGLGPVVNNCWIRGNAARSGGGMLDGLATNCVISGNTASANGGGMNHGTAINCTVRSNSAGYGGGTYLTEVINCMVIGNSAKGGGGVSWGSASNSVIYGNTAIGTGGGMEAATAVSCTISSNASGYRGGGMSGVYAHNCIICGNEAYDWGGGMSGGKAYNCTIVDNASLKGGGGMYFGIAYDSIIISNNVGGDIYRPLVYNSCSPSLTHGVDGNITNAPLFIDFLDGNYHLMSNSPCINWGSNIFTNYLVDRDGLPRIVGGFADMGAYEYQGDNRDDLDEDGLPDDWERDYFGFNASPFNNADQDGQSNGNEYIGGTDPTNAASFFAITNFGPASGFVIEWPCIEGRWYKVLWAPMLTNDAQVLEDFIEYPQNSSTDITHDVESAGFYTVEVRLK